MKTQYSICRVINVGHRAISDNNISSGNWIYCRLSVNSVSTLFQWIRSISKSEIGIFVGIGALFHWDSVDKNRNNLGCNSKVESPRQSERDSLRKVRDSKWSNHWRSPVDSVRVLREWKALRFRGEITSDFNVEWHPVNWIKDIWESLISRCWRVMAQREAG